MTTAQTTLTALLPLVFLPLGAAKIAPVPFMRRAAAHLGMSPGLYRLAGALEVAGAVGLVLGPAFASIGVGRPVRALPAGASLDELVPAPCAPWAKKAIGDFMAQDLFTKESDVAETVWRHERSNARSTLRTHPRGWTPGR
ncbi:DoxX family protein [Streptomyces sp. NPDC003943]